MNCLHPQPLTAEGFAPFGEVIQCAGSRSFPINGGTTERFHDLARIEPGPEGRVIVSIFRAQPRTMPMSLTMMERHPLASQAFVPMQERPYLVVVAESLPGSNAPGTLHAFMARGDQGVNYASGVWHHPLLALNQVSDFLVIDRQGTGQNCDEFVFADAVQIDV
jgi:ureidoglycolate lyase